MSMELFPAACASIVDAQCLLNSCVSIHYALHNGMS
jgi:hypothetical protein